MQIDLSRHAVIEASAGTGKTYAIEQLVLRLLTTADVKLEEILLVTFTEKATGELKARLRQAIDAAHQTTPHANLEDALDHFDQASIFTIHGFCQRLLHEYPLEQGHDFQAQLVDDSELLPSLLRNTQRLAWRTHYKDRLRDILDLACYRRKSAQQWENNVVELASKVREAHGDRLLPALIDGWPEVGQVEKAMREIVEGMRRHAGDPILAEDDHPWCACLGKKFDGRAKLLRAIKGVLTWLTEPRSGTLSSVARLFDLVEDWQRCGLIDAIANAPSPVKENFQSAFAEVWGLFEKLDALRPLRHQLAVHSVRLLQEEMEEFKRQRGMHSFDDLISRVALALDSVTSSSARTLLPILRQRYRWAIVDEFQDTDPVQWRLFNRLFLEEGESRLVVVGDPKQAIFAFRRADLPTYLTARQQLIEEKNADSQPLLVNWRSCPELLDALNQLFERSDWFAGTGIGYQAVQAPPDAERETRILVDRTQRSALTVVNVAGEGDKGLPPRPALKEYARYTALEIKRLLSAPDMLTFTKGKTERTLDAGDICILVSKRKEATPFVDGLRKCGVPYSFYKETGLWAGDEALQVRTILEALAEPDERSRRRRALLTKFFGISPEELAGCPEVPVQHPARGLLEQWQAWAEARRWSTLFRSLLFDTHLLAALAEEGQSERSLANYRHILGALEHRGYSTNCDLIDILSYYHDKQAMTKDSDYQPLETDAPRVRIMTIHASKGLEFPIVFLGGGFTRGASRGSVRYRDDDQRIVYDLAPDAAATERVKRENDSEERRLLYVALTRAMFKLYVPAMHPKQARSQFAGPLGTILRPALELARFDNGDIARTIDPTDIPDAPQRVIEIKKRAVAAVPNSVEAELDKSISGRRLVVHSFTSLHRQAAARVAEGTHFGEQEPRRDDDAPDALDKEDPLRGPVFGEMMHLALEKLDYATVAEASTIESLFAPRQPAGQYIDTLLADFLPRFRTRMPQELFKEACRRQVTTLVWLALRTPLAEVGGPLCDIPAADRLHEVEFLFAADEKMADIPETNLADGFVTGFMDLVLRKQGRYYLLDWKTNLLTGYGPDEMEEAMRASDYHLQYRIYTEALRRWLANKLGPAFDFEKAFGGVYYLFVRGMDGSTQNGVFYRSAGEVPSIST